MSVTSLDWRHLGACGPEDLHLFFGPEDEPAAIQRVRETNAAAICAVCPVRRDCLSYAVTTPQRHGVWGQVGEEGRARVRRNYLRHMNGYAA
jgi:WhiB family transcriptional regulator, redox-sensing transcriptional regulator